MKAALCASALALSIFLAAEAAHADTSDVSGASPSSSSAPTNPSASRNNTGLVTTGAILSVLGGVHLVLGAAALSARQPACSMMCFGPRMDVVGGLLVAAGSVLAIVGVPLIVIGATPTKPSAQLAVSPNGVSFAGTF